MCHTTAEASYVTGCISNKLFGMCRSKEFQLAGFPDFQATLNELKQFQKCPVPAYQVCVAVGNSMVIQEALVQFWSQKPDFNEQILQIVSSHDKEFNTTHLKRGGSQVERDQDDQQQEPAAKRLCLSKAKTLNELEGEFADRLLGFQIKL